MLTHALTDPAILSGRFWPRVEACYSRTWEHYDMPPHFHERVEIMLVLKGSALIHLYDYRPGASPQEIHILSHRVERMGPGEYMLLDQGLLHRLEVPGTSYMLNAEFAVVEAPQGLMSLKQLAGASPDFSAMLGRGQKLLRGRGASEKLLPALEQVVTEFSRPLPRDPALADLLLAALLLRIAENQKTQDMTSSALGYAHAAAEYLKAHCFNALRVQEVAAYVGIAPAYLQRIFKQAMGVTMVEYVNQLRVEQSRRLLAYTDSPIIDVAVACGFNSRQHFFRVFSAQTGMSPQQYRQSSAVRVSDQIYLFDNVGDHSYQLEEGPGD